MKAQEIRVKTTEDLRDLESELSAEIFKLRFSKVTEQLEKTDKLRIAKRNLARVKTILKERELGIVALRDTAAGEQ